MLSALILVAWFPGAALYRQHQQLASASAQLQRLDRQNAALKAEKARLTTSSEVARIARQQYELVEPGQQAYEVLPPNGSARDGSAYPGDPALQGPVDPSVAAVLPPGVLPRTTPGTTHHAAQKTQARSSQGLVSRILDTFEFWR